MHHFVPVAALLILTTPLAAQHDHSQHHSPYSEQESSGISSLSKQELDDLIQGAGMGLARPAELNRYPGPKHVLELAESLSLSPEQHAEVVRIHAAMAEEAKRLGEQIVEQERHLDMRFTHRHIDEDSLREATAAIAELYGRLRFTHLRAHLQTRDLLSESQIDSYDRLRGYSVQAEGAVSGEAL